MSDPFSLTVYYILLRDRKKETRKKIVRTAQTSKCGREAQLLRSRHCRTRNSYAEKPTPEKSRSLQRHPGKKSSEIKVKLSASTGSSLRSHLGSDRFTRYSTAGARFFCEPTFDFKFCVVCAAAAFELPGAFHVFQRVDALLQRRACNMLGSFVLRGILTTHFLYQFPSPPSQIHGSNNTDRNIHFVLVSPLHCTVFHSCIFFLFCR